MVDVQGTCDARFGPVRDALAGQLDSGNDTGASITVDVGGRTVPGLTAAASAAPETQRPLR